LSNLDGKRILLVGMGGLGCPAALALAHAGIGRLTIVDHDVVEASNLHRQPWYRLSDIGQPKVEVAARRLRAAFPALAVAVARSQVDDSRAPVLAGGHDVIIDGTDDVHAKFVLSDAGVRLGIPVVYGGVLRTVGQAMLIAPGGPCLRCLFDEPPAGEEPPSCARTGVLGTVAGLVGAIQASLALSVLTGDSWGRGQLVTIDAWKMSQRVIAIPRAPDCLVCAIRGAGLDRSAAGAAQ
jgi:adenylyltransferase/sulfurtransferase